MDDRFQPYIDVLNKELVKAMGCTEPIALAYAAAIAREVLEDEIQRIECLVSGNIIKNVKSVTVPNTNGLKGIEAAVAAGAAAGQAQRRLQVLSQVTPEQAEEIACFVRSVPITVIPMDGPHVLELEVRLYGQHHRSSVHIVDLHTNVTRVEVDGEEIPSEYLSQLPLGEHLTQQPEFTVKGILEFAGQVELERVMPILDQQIQCNMAIAEQGLREKYGADIGAIVLSRYGGDAETKAKAYAAAASDARMNGCQMPVVINSGSGNQGITASVPVIVYAREKGYGSQALYRALLVSNLCAIHIKTGIGRLSAYCGVVAAGAGAGAGIAYLEGGGLEAVGQTISNTLAITSGMICDGAKSSCAGKIMIALTAAFLGYHMYQEKTSFSPGDGIVKKSVEDTIASVGALASEGMVETDKEIIRIMMCG